MPAHKDQLNTETRKLLTKQMSTNLKEVGLEEVIRALHNASAHGEPFEMCEPKDLKKLFVLYDKLLKLAENIR